MPEYLPLGAFRQGLLPDDCRSCAWWQTAGASPTQGTEAADTRHEWLSDLDHDWGYVGLLVHDPGARREDDGSPDPVITASIQFAPASSLPRFRELPFQPLPPCSALLFCLHTAEDASRWVAKRVIRRALYELRSRGIREVYAVAHRPGTGDPDGIDCRFFCAESLTENGFAEVASNGHLALMRVDNRGLISLAEQAETALRRIFTREEEPAPSPAAWAREKH
jgi:hypothetical protein